jgi:hypothetical protein
MLPGSVPPDTMMYERLYHGAADLPWMLPRSVPPHTVKWRDTCSNERTQRERLQINDVWSDA